MCLLHFSAKAGRLVQWLHSRQYSLVLLFFVCSCTGKPGQTEATQGYDHAQAATLFYKNKVQVHHAKGFAVSYHDTYKMLYLLSAQDTIRYLLLPPGAPAPEGVVTNQIIRVPIQKVITQSTTHIGLFAALQAEDKIIAVDEADYIYSPKIRQRVARGDILEVGGGESLNMEKVLALAPDLLMVSGMPGTAMQQYQTLTEAGIPVLVNTEWMESTPLGKAEWLKLIAALTNQEQQANEKFTAIETQYKRVVALAAQIQDQPKVITGSPFQGVWYVPGGNSYRSRLFRQAGATWPWAQDTTAVSLPIDFETMYAYGLQADYWLNPGQINTKQDLLDKDARFADFKAFRQGQVYNNNRRMNPQGTGNDYYESGIVQPHRVLADVVKILHPALLPDDTLFFYQKIE